MSKPTCQLTGENGNIFHLIGVASRTLEDCGMHEEAKELQQRIWDGEAENYNQAICIIMEYVEVY